MIDKLTAYGIRGMPGNWFKSYLDNRQQYCSLNGKKSNMIEVTCGIPSGEARRKWMVVPITDLQTLKIYPKRQFDNCHFDRKGKVLLLENDHKNGVN